VSNKSRLPKICEHILITNLCEAAVARGITFHAKHGKLENVARKYDVMAAPPNTGVEGTARRSEQLSLYYAAEFG